MAIATKRGEDARRRTRHRLAVRAHDAAAAGRAHASAHARRGRGAAPPPRAGKAAARSDREGHCGLDDLLGAAGHRQDDDRARDRAATPIASSSRSRPSPRACRACARSSRKRRVGARLGRGTILFADEIHRFNKAQQDAFLPHVEAGTITLIGATTENPSFEINGALLSRVRVFVLQALTAGGRARADRPRAAAIAERGLGDWSLDARRRRARADRRRGGRRRAPRADRARGRGRARRARAATSPSRSRATRCSFASRATTRAAKRRTTCSAPSTRVCAAAIRRARSTGWRA